MTRRSIASMLIKGIEYLSLPCQFPRRFLPLLGKLLADRRLVHEIPRLAPHRKWFEQTNLRTVIDVGGFVGSFAYAMRTILPETQIYSFEPLEENFLLLERNLTPLGRFQAFRTALGDHGGTVEFHQNDFSASSSVLEMTDLHKRAFPQTKHEVGVIIPLARLDDYLESMELVPPVLLKVDVQGYESAVLQGAKQVLRQVDYLLTEVSFQELYTGQPLFADLHAALARQGFAYAGSLDTMLSPLDGTILQADALFVRRGKA